MATPVELSLEATMKLLENLPRADRERMLHKMQQEKVRKKTLGPQTDDELWIWVRDEIGIEIPRVAVCPCHQAPFAFFADAYFDRHDALLAIGSRESGKSYLAAIVNYAKAKFRPGHEGLTMGAIEEQSRRVYAHLQKFITSKEETGGRWKPEIRDSIRRETHFYNGSKFEIIPGTPAAANGPHPNTVHVDELDQMDPLAFAESRNMSSSGRTTDGTPIPAQDIATSTRKSAFGPVQEIVNEVEAAIEAGMLPPWKVFTWCVYENAQERPDCQKVSYPERAARLVELGRDPCELCDCHLIAKGELSPGKPRTLADVCQGKFFKSRGWMAPKDVQRKFRQNGELVWKAQQECTLPEPEGIYVKNWSRDRHTIKNWEPRPEYGPIYQGVDWGGDVPFAVEWYQGPIAFEVNVTSRIGHTFTIPVGAIINFAELYIADTSATKLADKVVARERLWQSRYPGWRVHARFADPAGRSDRNAWRDHDPPLRTHFYVDREFEPMVNTVIDLVDDGLFFVVEDECPAFCDEIEAWRKDKNGRQYDKYNHAISAWRYAMKNIEYLERKRGRRIGQAPGDARRSGVSKRPVAVASGRDRQYNDQLWRQELGYPAPGVSTAPWDPNRR